MKRYALWLLLVLAPLAIAGGGAVSGGSFTSGPSGGGTTNRVAKWTGAFSLGDSLISCDGTNCTLTSGAFLVPDDGVFFANASGSGMRLNTAGNNPMIKSGGLDVAQATAAGRWVPAGDNSRDLGQTNVRWRFGYFGTQLGIYDAGAFTASLIPNMLVLTGGAKTDTDCDAAAEEGRIFNDTTNGIIYVCDQTGSSTGWAVLLDYSS